MFILGMFWKRTTGAAAVAGVITGLGLCLFFNEYAPAVFGNNTWLYTAYPNGNGGYEIPFLIAMGLSFFFTVLTMVLISLAGPKINPKSFVLDSSMFKLKPQTTALIAAILLMLVALYIKFW
jgi:SSS family solute:Na+ symporter